MPWYKVAHIREQGVDLIIIPLESAFDNLTETQKYAQIQELQLRANAAGLAGTVVPVWEHLGQVRFIALPQWHSFLASLTLPQITASVNKEIRW
jgi:hypothetical protein